MSRSPLTSGELDALRGLQRKKDGVQVPFVNIRDARALTALGFADRSREGWEITSEGLARLALEGDPAPARSPLHVLHDLPVITAAVEPPAPPAKPDVVERWIYLRTLLLEQLAAFETGGLQLHSGPTNVSADAMAKVRAGIAEFDALIAAEEFAAP
jgi:hypothetical protein